MTRDDAIWIAIRVFGLLFLYKAAIAAVGVINLIAALSVSYTMMSELATEEGQKAYLALIEAVSQTKALTTPVELLLYFLAAWYFLKGAPALSHFISSRAGPRKTAA